MIEIQANHGPDLTTHDLGQGLTKPKQPWDEIIISAKELTEGVFSIIINENVGLYNVWERMTREEEQRIKGLLAEYIEKEILERF